jgi:hypothetical protein
MASTRTRLLIPHTLPQCLLAHALLRDASPAVRQERTLPSAKIGSRGPCSVLECVKTLAVAAVARVLRSAGPGAGPTTAPPAWGPRGPHRVREVAGTRPRSGAPIRSWSGSAASEPCATPLPLHQPATVVWLCQREPSWPWFSFITTRCVGHQPSPWACSGAACARG